jgi:hypothetical protein
MRKLLIGFRGLDLLAGNFRGGDCWQASDLAGVDWCDTAKDARKGSIDEAGEAAPARFRFTCGNIDSVL